MAALDGAHYPIQALTKILDQPSGLKLAFAQNGLELARHPSNKA
jgi:hypothetical protein